MNSRKAILNRIRTAVKTPANVKNDNPDSEQIIKDTLTSITPKGSIELWKQFKNELGLINGEYFRVNNTKEAAEIIYQLLGETSIDTIASSSENVCNNVLISLSGKMKNLTVWIPDELNFTGRKKVFSNIQAAVVHPSFAVADFGSLVFLYDDTGTSLPHFLCNITFALIFRDQIVANQFELFEKINSEKSKNMVFVAGPSRTADIEKVLVLGAHGPRRLIVIHIEQNSY